MNRKLIKYHWDEFESITDAVENPEVIELKISELIKCPNCGKVKFHIMPFASKDGTFGTITCVKCFEVYWLKL